MTLLVNCFHIHRPTISLVTPEAFAMDPTAQARDETPVQRLFSEWVALYAAFHATDAHLQWSDDDWDHHLSALDDIEDKIEDAPVLNLRDLGLKHAAMTSFGEITE